MTASGISRDQAGEPGALYARGGTYIVLVFAAVWLWMGASALPGLWKIVAGAVGAALLLAVVWHVLRRPLSSARSSRFNWWKFLAAVAFEIVAGNLVAMWLGRHDLMGYLWPAFGIVVGLHFIGLWWASQGRRFITLTVAMVAVNSVALFFPRGSVAMLAISGLGSSVVLMAVMART